VRNSTSFGGEERHLITGRPLRPAFGALKVLTVTSLGISLGAYLAVCMVSFLENSEIYYVDDDDDDD